MKPLKTHMQAACVVTIGLLSLPSYSYAQILPDHGKGLGDSYINIESIESSVSKRKGKVQSGLVTPIACGKHYYNYSSCYLWTPDNDAFEKRCVRTTTDLLIGSEDVKRSWVGAMRDDYEFVMYMSKPFTPSKINIDERRWRRMAADLAVFDCTASETPFVFENNTALNPLVREFDYELERGALENCLLAEHFTYNPSQRHGYDRTRFFCLEVDSNDSAVSIAERFKSAYSDNGSFIYRETKDPNRRHFSTGLSSKQLAYTDLTQAAIQIATVSVEEVEAFYERTGATPEITSGKAAIVFAIDEILVE